MYPMIYFYKKVSSTFLLLNDLNIDTVKEDNAIKHELYDIYNVEDLVHEPTSFKQP